LGASSPSLPFTEVGNLGQTDFTWITYTTDSNTIDRHLYAISGEMTVPATVPEPATTMMMTLGGVLMIGARRRVIHRKNQATRTLC
jgi:hypothetical protein